MPDEDNSFGGFLISFEFTKMMTSRATQEYLCLFVHVFLSSTQFSSDQIQNGGVNSDGRLPF